MREAPNSFPRPGQPVRLVGLMTLMLAAAGCGGKYKPVPVSGTVTLDGKPLEGAMVNFYSIGDAKEGRGAHGTTDKNGAFSLTTMKDGDGAIRGDYKVVINKFVPTLPNLKIPDFPDTPDGKAQRDDFMYNTFEKRGLQPFKTALPAKYADSSATPLTFKVTGPTTEANFPLVSK
jgi:hypothetical protein